MCTDGCNCYCGCDTVANRIKFATSGGLFLLWIGLRVVAWSVVSSSNCDEEYDNDFRWGSWVSTIFGKLNVVSDCKKTDVGTVLEPIDCKVAREHMASCVAKLGGVIMILALLSFVASIGMFVPLCMLCCCTKNPHKGMEQGTELPSARPITGAASNPFASDSGELHMQMQSLEVPPEGPANIKAMRYPKQSKQAGYDALLAGQEALDPQ